MGRRVLKFDGAFGPEGGGIALVGDEFYSRSAAPVKNCGASRHHNPQAKGLSNLRTLRPIGPVNLKNLFLSVKFYSVGEFFQKQ